jgi:hypothetical protein
MLAIPLKATACVGIYATDETRQNSRHRAANLSPSRVHDKVATIAKNSCRSICSLLEIMGCALHSGGNCSIVRRNDEIALCHDGYDVNPAHEEEALSSGMTNGLADS